MSALACQQLILNAFRPNTNPQNGKTGIYKRLRFGIINILTVTNKVDEFDGLSGTKGSWGERVEGYLDDKMVWLLSGSIILRNQ